MVQVGDGGWGIGHLGGWVGVWVCGRRLLLSVLGQEGNVDSDQE